MSVVGLDFGCKNAVIAAAGRGGVDVILNGNSNRLNPCMVGFDQSRTMGEQAGSTASSNYKNTVYSMKRLVGLPFDNPSAQAEMKRCSFSCVPINTDGQPSSIGVKVNYNSEEKVIPIEAVAGMMVKHMGDICAEKSAAAGGDIQQLFPKDWVVSVPSYYTDAQKRAFLSGCQVSGIDVRRLMHENTATALAYGIFKDIRKEFANKDEPTHVMFIDLGATSYTVSVVDFVPGKLIVKSTQSDSDLGGREFDLKIAQWFADKFEEKYKGKLSAKPMSKPKVMLKLLAAAEKAKKTLSPAGVKEVRMQVECIMDDLDFGITLTSAKYEEMCQPLLNRLNAPVQRALDETKLKPSDLSSIEVVGGGSRVSCVKIMLATTLGLDKSAINYGLSTTMNADESVARGCALQSAILSPRFKVLPYEIIEYQPYPIQVSWEGESENGHSAEMEGEGEGNAASPNSVVMFDRGSNFPCVRRVTLRRSGEFKVVASYHESSLNHFFPEGCTREIATFQIKSIASGENKIRVNVKQDLHGIVSLSSAQVIEEIMEEEEPAEAAKEGEAKKEEAKEEEGAEGEAKKEGEVVEAKKEVEKKKKVKKTNLESTTSRPTQMTKVAFDAAFELEVAMANADRIVKETADLRNELESYVYDMRDKIISESSLKSYCTSSEAASFSSELEKCENWLYEDGFDAAKKVYVEKLAGLKKYGDKIQYRMKESQTRPNAFSSLKSTVEKYTNWLNSSVGDEKFAHITDEERTKCHTKCDETSGWMYEMLDKQGSLAVNADPAVTTAQIITRNKELSNSVSPIMHKPVPKPKAVPKPEPEKKEEKKEEKNEDDVPAPMDTGEETKVEAETKPMDTSA